MGIVAVIDPTDYFVDEAGSPPTATRILGSRARTSQGWNTKPATPDMEYFKSKMVLAARAHAWTRGGMAVEHLRHYLGGTGADYVANMNKMLEEPLVRDRFATLERLAGPYALGRGLEAGAQFRSTKTVTMVPRTTKGGQAEDLRTRDTWYAVGTFQGWIEARVLKGNRLQLDLRMLDIYDWDQDEFTLPIPASVCSKMDSFLFDLTAGRVLDNLRTHGQITIDDCKITVEDSVMHQLHLMGLAKNYLTRGSHTKTIAMDNDATAPRFTKPTQPWF